ncbi:MAG: hypothetical protein NZO16_07425 [Deltaproteobacteria bacterium]|nr:hypothetical protein [Deltaproteobacteria bacterium]
MSAKNTLIGFLVIKLLIPVSFIFSQANEDFLKSALNDKDSKSSQTPSESSENSVEGVGKVSFSYTIDPPNADLNFTNSDSRSKTEFYLVEFIGHDGSVVGSTSIHVTVSGNGSTKKSIVLPPNAAGLRLLSSGSRTVSKIPQNKQKENVDDYQNAGQDQQVMGSFVETENTESLNQN